MMVYMQDKITTTTLNKHIFILTCFKLCKKEGMIEYFREHYSNVSVINFPTHRSKSRAIRLSCYNNNQLVLDKNLLSLPRNILFSNFVATNIIFALTTFWSLLYIKRRFDLVVSEGLINTMFALILSKLRLCRKVIYSSGDYFNQSQMFVRADYYLSKRVYQVWSASEEMVKIRLANSWKFNNRHNDLISDKVMPLGIRNTSLPRNISSVSLLKNIAIMGNVQKRLGYDLILSAIVGNSQLETFQVIVIGDGEYLEEFKKKVHESKMDNNFLFFGFIEDDRLIDFILSTCFAGLALYDPEKMDHTQYSDPGKIKDYISRDLPIIFTGGTTISDNLISASCGLVTKYSVAELTSAILEMHNKKINEQLTKNIIDFKCNLSWSSILTPLLSNVDL